MEEFIDAAINLGGYKWRQIKGLAAELANRSILPVTGAGASCGCRVKPGVPSAGELARRLHAGVEGGAIQLSPRPDGFGQMKKDLGNIAEAICLQNKPSVVLDALGFDKSDEWPGAADIEPHACPYRVLARMAREQLIEETLTFNYDCHNEAACAAEGFLLRNHMLSSQLWPSRYGVVSTPADNASVDRRADFTVIKAHGCVESWRIERPSWTPSSGRPDPSDRIVIRRSQLLDWREDFWVRDLVAERARRHILMLIGCSAQDPVIQISLKRLMDEVRKVDPKGPARIRVLDIKPNTLALRSVMKASGVGPTRSDRRHAEIIVPGKNADHQLGGMLTALLTELMAGSLMDFSVPWATMFPAEIGPRTTLLAQTAPTMVRWSWWLLGKSRLGAMGLAVDLQHRRDNCYVPLLADPIVTLRATAARRRLLARLGRDLEAHPAEVRRSGFVVNDARAAAAIPLGLSRDDLLAGRSQLARATRELETPGLELYAALAGDEADQLHFYSLPHGKEVAAIDAPF